MDKVFEMNWNVNEYVMMNEMFDEEGHRKHMYQVLKDYFHLNMNEKKKINLKKKR